MFEGEPRDVTGRVAQSITHGSVRLTEFNETWRTASLIQFGLIERRPIG